MPKFDLRPSTDAVVTVSLAPVTDRLLIITWWASVHIVCTASRGRSTTELLLPLKPSRTYTSGASPCSSISMSREARQEGGRIDNCCRGQPLIELSWWWKPSGLSSAPCKLPIWVLVRLPYVRGRIRRSLSIANIGCLRRVLQSEQASRQEGEQLVLGNMLPR